MKLNYKFHFRKLNSPHLSRLLSVKMDVARLQLLNVLSMHSQEINHQALMEDARSFTIQKFRKLIL